MDARSTRRRRRLLSSGCCALLSALFSMPGAQAGPRSSVAYQITPGHTGEAVPGTRLQVPPVRLWSADLRRPASYPLIADGKVFVDVGGTPGGGAGTAVVALDGATGAIAWGPIELGGSGYWAYIAYDAGRVYAVDHDGLLRAFASADGSLLWSAQLGVQLQFTSPPTAVDGAVYVNGASSNGGGATLYAIDDATGLELWHRPAPNTVNAGGPAVGDGGVFVSDDCPEIDRYATADGAPVWQFSATQCLGATATAAVYRDGVLLAPYTAVWNRFPSLALDAATGNVLNSGIPIDLAPAISASNAYAVFSGSLFGMSTFNLVHGGGLSGAFQYAGDNALNTPPLLVDHYVIVGSSLGHLFAFDQSTPPAYGGSMWSDDLGIPMNVQPSFGGLVYGMAAGDGLMVVPAGSTLFAYPLQEVAADVPTVSITASAGQVNPGDPVTLTWSSTAADSCEATQDWSGPRPPSGSEVVTPSRNGYNYFFLSCSNTAGSAGNSVGVLVGDPAAVTLQADTTSAKIGDTVTLSWTTTAVSECFAGGDWQGQAPLAGSYALVIARAGSNTFTLSCDGPSGYAVAIVTVQVPQPPAVSLHGSTGSVYIGGAATLTWSATNADRCNASGDWSGVEPTAGSQSVVINRVGANSFTLSCTGPGGTASSIVAIQGTPTPVPPTLSLSADQSRVIVGATVTLRWTSTDTQSCTASGDWFGVEPLAGEQIVGITHIGANSFTLSCAGPGGSIAATATVTAPPPAPQLSLQADRPQAIVGTYDALSWTTSNATSCNASGDWSGPQPTSGIVAQPITHVGSNIFTLTCYGDGGSVAASATVTGVLPVLEFAQLSEPSVAPDRLGRSTTAIAVQLTPASPSAVVVPLIAGGSTPPQQYTVSPSGSLRIPAGAQSATITVTLDAAARLQCGRDVVLTLGPAPNVMIGTTGSNTLQISRSFLPKACGSR